MLLVLTICHVLNGGCVDKQLPVPEAPSNPMMCLMQAQPVVAEYMQMFPNYRVSRTRCMSEDDARHLEHRA